MSEWQIKSFYHLKANSESEAWSLANLELPAGSQITSVSESEQVMCNFCVANNKAVHFPNDGEFYCSECFHGVSLEKAIRIEGCETCELSYESERASEPLCGDHLVPVSQCNCLWGYKRGRGGK